MSRDTSNLGPQPGDSNSTTESQTPVVEVYGTPGDGYVPRWNAASSRFEWTNPAGAYSARSKVGPFLGLTFSGNEGLQQSLSAYLSVDGKDWGANPGNPVAVPAANTGFRDPSFVVIDGVTYCAVNIGTTTGGVISVDDHFTILRSEDPMRAGSWSIYATIDATAALAAVSGGQAGAVWAPDLFLDDDGTLYCTVTIKGKALYWTSTTAASNYATWTALAAVTGTGITTNTIDSTIIKLGSTYHLICKDLSTSRLMHLTSSSPMSGYTVAQDASTWLPAWPAPTGDGYEGANLVKLSSTTLRMYVDKRFGSVAGVHWTDTTDLTLGAGCFPAPTACTVGGKTQGSGSVVPIMRHGAFQPLRNMDEVGAGLRVGAAPAVVEGSTISDKFYNGGNITLSSTAWARLTTSLDVSMALPEGALVRLVIGALWQNGTVEGQMDVGTIAADDTTITVRCSGGTSLTNTGRLVGIQSLFAGANATGSSGIGLVAVSCDQLYRVRRTDLRSDGTVKFSPVARVGQTGSRAVSATVNEGIFFYVQRLT